MHSKISWFIWPNIKKALSLSLARSPATFPPLLINERILHIRFSLSLSLNQRENIFLVRLFKNSQKYNRANFDMSLQRLPCEFMPSNIDHRSNELEENLINSIQEPSVIKTNFPRACYAINHMGSASYWTKQTFKYNKKILNFLYPNASHENDTCLKYINPYL